MNNILYFSYLPDCIDFEDLKNHIIDRIKHIDVIPFENYNDIILAIGKIINDYLWNIKVYHS